MRWEGPGSALRHGPGSALRQGPGEAIDPCDRPPPRPAVRRARSTWRGRTMERCRQELGSFIANISRQVSPPGVSAGGPGRHGGGADPAAAPGRSRWLLPLLHSIFLFIIKTTILLLFIIIYPAGAAGFCLLLRLCAGD